MQLRDNDNLLSDDHTDNTDERYFLSQVSKDLRNNFNYTYQKKSKVRKSARSITNASYKEKKIQNQ